MAWVSVSLDLGLTEPWPLWDIVMEGGVPWGAYLDFLAWAALLVLGGLNHVGGS